MEKLYTKAIIEEKTGEEITAIASTAVEDRQGEIVEVTGWDLKEFKKNPIILWGHDHNEPAIGQATKTWVDGTGKSAKLMVKIAFQEVTQRAREIKQLVQDGVIKTLSVGFLPIDGEGNRYTKQQLLEVSVVNVPANPEAMMLGYKSLKKAGFTNEAMTDVGIPAAFVEDMLQMKSQMEIMKSQIDSAVKGLNHLNPLGRDRRVVTDRLQQAKTAVRAADYILERKQATDQTARQAKIIKRANEILITSLKGELTNGKNQRTSGEAR